MTMDINAATIIEALGGNPTTGMCKCPAHDDRKPSLKVTQTPYRVLVRCFAGCGQVEVVEALRGRGLWRERKKAQTERQANDNHEEEKEDTSRKAYGIISLAYVQGLPRTAPSWRRYASAWVDGPQDITPSTYLKNRGLNIVPPNALILSKKWTGMLTGKHFPAMVCTISDGAGYRPGEGIIGAHVTFLNLDGTAKLESETPRLTYGHLKIGFVICSPLPEEPLEELIIGEGIETTLSAMQLAGLPGIAALAGWNLPAIKVPPARKVIIAADNDDAGRKGAAELAELLEYAGRTVVIAMPPVEDEDWNDRLLKAPDALAEWTAAIAKTKTEKEPSGSIAALELSEFLNLTFPKRELLLKPWLPKPGLVMVHAPRGEGKTYFALSVGNAIARGAEFCGWPASRGRVLYVDGELPGDFLQQRLNKLPPVSAQQFFVLSRDTFLLRKQLMPNLSDADGRAVLNTIIEQCEPDLLILDSLSTLVRGGVENEAESWAPIQDWLLNWRWKGLSIILVHHEGKSGKPRGTSKREDTLDTMIGLAVNAKEPAEENNTAFDLTFTKSRHFFGKDAAALRLRLQVVEGKVQWTQETIKDARKEQIREMLAAKMTHAVIAKELGISRVRVTQMAKEIETGGSSPR